MKKVITFVACSLAVNVCMASGYLECVTAYTNVTTTYYQSAKTQHLEAVEAYSHRLKLQEQFELELSDLLGSQCESVDESIKEEFLNLKALSSDLKEFVKVRLKNQQLSSGNEEAKTVLEFEREYFDKVDRFLTATTDMRSSLFDRIH